MVGDGLVAAHPVRGETRTEVERGIGPPVGVGVLHRVVRRALDRVGVPVRSQLVAHTVVHEELGAVVVDLPLDVLEVLHVAHDLPSPSCLRRG